MIDLATKKKIVELKKKTILTLRLISHMQIFDSSLVVNTLATNKQIYVYKTNKIIK